jgi:hypothetical protein
VQDAHRAALHRGGAGEAVVARQHQALAALLDQFARAGDVAGVVVLVRAVEDRRAVQHQVAGQRTRRAARADLQRAAAGDRDRAGQVGRGDQLAAGDGGGLEAGVLGQGELARLHQGGLEADHAFQGLGVGLARALQGQGVQARAGVDGAAEAGARQDGQGVVAAAEHHGSGAHAAADDSRRWSGRRRSRR